MPIKSCWSNNSGSICHPSRRLASRPPQPPPRMNPPTPRNPAPCSGDLSNSPIDSARFFPPVEKVGLALRLFLCRVPAGFPPPADDYLDELLDLNKKLISQVRATLQ